MDTKLIEIGSIKDIIKFDYDYSITQSDINNLQIKLIELSNDPIIPILTKINFKWVSPNNRKAIQ